ncbi:hypothetical protein OESDEN_03678 [Oesophagostomum dentatum]|uniref:MRG domain-containing protein n=1 Tax=Oesophagostomum dentatum TaxID=61180 RepID=A0A0B1TLS7_OESDE|nr:hypothetical protein OESDEN_03678 [Oesophagostomum dentatum]
MLVTYRLNSVQLLLISRIFKPNSFVLHNFNLQYCAELGFSPKEGEDSAIADAPSGLGSSALGLRDFFNRVLGFQLLYKFERPQYAAELEKAVGSSDAVSRKRKSNASSPEDNSNALVPSKLYGLPHLLRLIVRLASLLRDVPWNDTVFRASFFILLYSKDIFQFNYGLPKPVIIYLGKRRRCLRETLSSVPSI